MRDLGELHHAVRTTLAAGRIGQPVFVRYLLQSPARTGAAARLARMTAAVCGWLGQRLERVYAIGSAQSGQISLTLQFREGASALVSIARGQPLGDGVDLMILGNRGAIYHDAGHSVPGADAPPFPETPPDTALVAAIAKALRSGKPEAVAAGVEP
jgi:hypothetical protein